MNPNNNIKLASIEDFKRLKEIGMNCYEHTVPKDQQSFLTRFLFWRYFSTADAQRVLGAVFVSFIIYLIGTWIIVGRMPWSYYIMGVIFQFLFCIAVRVSYRIFLAISGDNNRREFCKQRRD